MAKTKQKTPSASQRREQQRQQRQQRVNVNQKSQAQSRNRRKIQNQSNRNSWLLIGGVLVLVAIIVVAFIVISHQPSGTTSAPTPASAAVLKAVTQVDPSVSNTVGTGNVKNPLQSIKNPPPPLTGSTGKPEFLYMGAEYCPYCAAERWAMVVALSRFGTFSHLDQTTSSSSDVYPSTPTFTFYHSTYTSSYIDFVPVEMQGNVQDSSGNYPTLQTPTADQQNLLSKYDAPPYISASSAGSIPFIDIANKYVQIGLGQGYSAQDLAGLQWQDIATDLSEPSSPVAQHILGSANYLTAAICIATNQQPGSVCNSSTIQQIEHTITSTSFNAGGPQIAAAAGYPEADVRRQN
jgi:thiol-disulfide isomerase/thioredoxin